MSAALRVVVFGPTGTAGSEVVRQCLEDVRVAEVLAITRRETGLTHAKLRDVVCADFDDLTGIVGALTDVDACFFCLGISQSQAEDEAHYRRITVSYAVNAARALLEQSPKHTFHYLSGQGTDPSKKSWMMWARVKGEAENELRAISLHRLFLYRPGYIHPERAHAKGGAGAAVSRVLFPVIRAVTPGAAIRAVELARAMIEATMSDSPGGTLENRSIRALGEQHPAAIAEKE
jgi:uncharacterized protein YbjT (DUF2867 family)